MSTTLVTSPVTLRLATPLTLRLTLVIIDWPNTQDWFWIGFWIGFGLVLLLCFATSQFMDLTIPLSVYLFIDLFIY